MEGRNERRRRGEGEELGGGGGGGGGRSAEVEGAVRVVGTEWEDTVPRPVRQTATAHRLKSAPFVSIVLIPHPPVPHPPVHDQRCSLTPPDASRRLPPPYNTQAHTLCPLLPHLLFPSPTHPPTPARALPPPRPAPALPPSQVLKLVAEAVFVWDMELLRQWGDLFWRRFSDAYVRLHAAPYVRSAATADAGAAAAKAAAAARLEDFAESLGAVEEPYLGPAVDALAETSLSARQQSYLERCRAL
eukprot:364795-Chlamydomonas_euryale.AAC.28